MRPRRRPVQAVLLIAPLMELKLIIGINLSIALVLLIAPLMELKCVRYKVAKNAKEAFNRTAYGIEIRLSCLRLNFPT